METWELEVDVRQANLDNLPTNPISLTHLFETSAFNGIHYNLTTKNIDEDSINFSANEPLYFYDNRNNRVPYAILQIAFLADCASNVLKHGGGRAEITVTKRHLSIRNKIVNDPNAKTSNKTGLKALQDLGNKYNMPIHFEDKKDDFFSVIIQVRCEPAVTKRQKNEPDASESPSMEKKPRK